MPHKEETEDDTSSVDSESSSSDDEIMLDESNVANEIALLERGIGQRQKLISKLLYGKEDTEIAKGIQEKEHQVNSYLLKTLHNQLQSSSEESKPSTVTRSNPTAEQLHNNHSSLIQTMKQSISREIKFTLPGTISLLVHCALYLSIYGCLNKLLEWICDKGIIYLTGWHISENAFDCTHHERIFHVVCLVVGCLMARLTGSIWAWNDNEIFQEELRADMKTRCKSSWDVRMIRWFKGKGGNNKWGPRCKLFIDGFSFFIAYIAVDKLLMLDFGGYALDSRAVILEGMPSRQLSTVSGVLSVEDKNGSVNQCTALESTNDTSSEECSIATKEEVFVSDIMNWLENSNRCRWVEEKSEDDDQEEDEGSKFRPWKRHDEQWKQLVNEKDEEYLLEKISYKTYYELVGDPNIQFIDPQRETIFCAVITLGGFGVLLGIGAPWLLI